MNDKISRVCEIATVYRLCGRVIRAEINGARGRKPRFKKLKNYPFEGNFRYYFLKIMNRRIGNKVVPAHDDDYINLSRNIKKLPLPCFRVRVASKKKKKKKKNMK